MAQDRIEYELRIDDNNKRAIVTNNKRSFCHKCLMELRDGDQVYWCEMLKKISCTKKICKEKVCYYADHEDWFGTLRVLP